MKITLRVELEGKCAEKFLKLKEKIGLKTNTEVIRALIEKASRLENIV